MVEVLWLNPHRPVVVLDHTIALIHHLPEWHPQMRPLIKQVWIKALLSGKYEQLQRGYLHDRRHDRRGMAPGRYSAGGVLCDIYLRATGQHWSIPDTIGRRSCLGNPIAITAPVRAWAGLPEQMPIDLIRLNQRYNFAVIASFIEASL